LTGLLTVDGLGALACYQHVGVPLFTIDYAADSLSFLLRRLSPPLRNSRRSTRAANASDLRAATIERINAPRNTGTSTNIVRHCGWFPRIDRWSQGAATASTPHPRGLAHCPRVYRRLWDPCAYRGQHIFFL